MQPSARRTLWLAIFAIAMGGLEAAVVVYLRELYYPGGFRFPLVPLAPGIAAIEIGREVCTIVMLLAVAVLAAQDRVDGFFAFAFLFGIWDLVYYAGLKLLLGWPDSVLGWDVLFLIPVPWVAPVLAPVLISLLFVAGFTAHSWLLRRNRSMRPNAVEWSVAVAAAAVVILSFCWRFQAALTQPRMPGFPWLLFALGVVMGLVPLARAIRRAGRSD